MLPIQSPSETTLIICGESEGVDFRGNRCLLLRADSEKSYLLPRLQDEAEGDGGGSRAPEELLGEVDPGERPAEERDSGAARGWRSCSALK